MLPGFAIAGYLLREDPREHTRISTRRRFAYTNGTGSPRRRAQLTKLFPGAQFTEIRGNVDTRSKKSPNNTSPMPPCSPSPASSASAFRAGPAWSFARSRSTRWFPQGRVPSPCNAA